MSGRFNVRSLALCLLLALVAGSGFLLARALFYRGEEATMTISQLSRAHGVSGPFWDSVFATVNDASKMSSPQLSKQQCSLLLEAFRQRKPDTIAALTMAVARGVPQEELPRFQSALMSALSFCRDEHVCRFIAITLVERFPQSRPQVQEELRRSQFPHLASEVGTFEATKSTP